jgi:NitT/TauT family transport system ATP-binding protein
MDRTVGSVSGDTDLRANGDVDPRTGSAAAEAADTVPSDSAPSSGDGWGPAPTKLHVEGLVKSYRVKGGSLLALDGVDLDVPAGGFVSLVGTSGCGKSTLLNIVAGLEQPTSGMVTVDGDLVVGPGPDRGVVFQAYSLFPWRTVAENVAFGLECQGVSRSERRRRTAEMLGVVELTEFADLLPRELSGGMRQRVAIARSLVTEPDLLLLDEPFGALDLQTRQSLHEFLRHVWQRTGATVVMVTHDVGEAIYLSDQVVVLTARPGRVAERIDVPFGRARGPEVRRDRRFLDLEDEVDDLLHGRR